MLVVEVECQLRVNLQYLQVEQVVVVMEEAVEPLQNQEQIIEVVAVEEPVVQELQIQVVTVVLV